MVQIKVGMILGSLDTLSAPLFIKIETKQKATLGLTGSAVVRHIAGRHSCLIWYNVTYFNR